MADDPHGDTDMGGTQPPDQELGADHDSLFGDGGQGDPDIEPQGQDNEPPEVPSVSQDDATAAPHEEIFPSIEGLPNPLSDMPEDIDDDALLGETQYVSQGPNDFNEDALLHEIQNLDQGHEDTPPSDNEDLQEHAETLNGVQGGQGEPMDGIENEDQQEVEDDIQHILEERNQTFAEQPQGLRQEREGSPLFVPEGSLSIPSTRAAPSRMHPPSFRPLAGASAGPSASSSSRAASQPPMSTFAKIRSLQKKLQQSKTANSRPQYSQQQVLDNESYLDAIRPSRPGFQHAGASVDPPEDDDDRADREAAAEYRKQIKRYEQLKNSNGGRLTFRQDVQWMNIQRAERQRQDKRKRDLRKDQEDDREIDLFPDIGGPSDVQEAEDSEDDMVDSSSSRKRRKPEMPRKEPKRISIQQAELNSMEVALDAARDATKNKRRGQVGSEDSAKPRARAKPKAPRQKVSSLSFRGGPVKAPAKRGRKSAKDKAAAIRASRQATSLLTADVFQDQAPEDAPEEPILRSRNKQLALKELMMSVPIDSQKAVRGDMASIIQASKSFDGRGAAKLDGNGMWIVKGMKTSLKGYQLLGSAFMRDRENAEEQPHGGLMADQMGLGKTLMMLANIVNGHPGKVAKCKTTLLVATPALLTQWAREITLHTNMEFKIMRYGSGNRIDSNASFEVLELHDIILTTYGEILRSYPKNDPPIKCQTAEEKIEWWKDAWETRRGVLHRMLFHRVVLDEAQAIKNHDSRTSIACRALMAHHKWALSGTPILNSVTELYPYFKFLDVPHTGSFRIFKENYCDPTDLENNERLLVRLSQFMIRRTHADRMFNAPILKLPKADQLTHWENFNAVERNIYDIVEERFIECINTFSMNGELDKSYSNVLVMLLRLRQLTSHPLMLQFVMRDLLQREDIERIREVVKSAAADTSSVGGRTVIAIRKQLEKHAADEKNRTAKIAAENGIRNDEDDSVNEEESDDDGEGPSAANGDTQPGERKSSGKSFGKSYNFKPYLNSLTTGKSWKKAKEKARCAYGNHRPKKALLTSCGHLTCEECYYDKVAEAAEQGTDRVRCGVCETVFERTLPLDTEQDDAEAFNAPETRAMKKNRDRIRKRIEQEDIATDWLTFDGDEVLPSAKTIAVKAQIMNWVKESKDVKIIIYSQFLTMIRILAKMCQEEGWETEQYHGKMSYKSRDEAIGRFADNPNVRVLLASLRCGGLGLNLTMAQRVIILDPWWNSAAEQQAFCRVFRYGQKEKTFLTRFCVRNTIDERLINMQKRKQEEIDGVMEDGGNTVKKMSMRDLIRLFGNLKEDEGGKPFIFVDNPDPRGGFRPGRDHEGYADDL